MEQLTKNQAIEMAKSEWWKDKPAKDVALFQMQQDKLCMDFSEFHRCMEETLGRPVWTHEFASSNRDALMKELLGEKEPPSMNEIISLIPQQKLIIVNT